MGHLIEEYAKSLGVKIGKPVLVDHYYPTLAEKYITIHCDSKIDSKYYEYFPQVVNLLIPYLNKYGYKIYQIGGLEDPKIHNVNAWFLNLTYKQSAFLIKNSSLHIGIDSLPIHIASIYNIPIVALYSHIYPSNAYPYWSDQDKVSIIESDRKSYKPSFSYQESPKSIRTIKPETIVNEALRLLSIEENVNFKTLYIGSLYHIPLVEVVPNFKANLEDQKNNIIYIRADLHFDDQNIAFWCANYKSKIISEKEIPLGLLHQFNKNIDHVYFKIKDKSISNEYFEELKKLKIKYTICCLDESTVPEIRNNYFDHLVEFDNINERIQKQEKFNSKFLTNKVIISNGIIYPSEAHIKLGKNLDSINEVVYDDDAFWKDAEHFYFYE
jgi:hypothetical protein